MASAHDVETGLTFGAFVLKWHVDRKLYGHALEYGEFCPNDLKRLVASDPEFGQYFLDIWLSPETTRPELRERLLGQR